MMTTNNQHLKRTLEPNGRTRLYELYLPAQIKELDKVPLLCVLHGAGGNAAYARRMVDVEALADEKGFIVVYPNGTGIYQHAVLTWNAGHCCGYARDHNIDDVGFINRLLDTLCEEFPVNQNRIFLTGISNGAMMAHRLACELSGRVTAIAPVAGGIGSLDWDVCKPVSVIAFHGLKDGYAPYEGGAGEKTPYRREDFPIQTTIDFWVKKNKCAPKPVVHEYDEYRIEKYENGQNNSRVFLYTLFEQGHAWPGGKPGIKYGNLEPPYPGLSATRLIWDFFSEI